MKTTVLSFVVALSAFTTISHAGCNQELLRSAEAMRCTADSLVREFREEIEDRSAPAVMATTPLCTLPGTVVWLK